MADSTYMLVEGIRDFLHENSCDLMSFSRLPDQEEYVIRIKRRRNISLQVQKPTLDGIYLPNGKLNISYLAKNAELLFEAGDYSSAKKIYKTIIQSGERNATFMNRIEKCNERERLSH